MSDESRHRRLPDDPAYWDGLAARAISAALRSTPDRTHETAVDGPTAWWTSASDAAPALAAAAVVVALLGGSLLLGGRPARAGPAPDAIAGALYPADAMLQSLLRTPGGPPPASALVSLIALREAER